MGRPLAQGHHQQRALILDRAARAFAPLGYASASMADVALACDISKAALYHYFESKEAILYEALNTYTRELQTIVRDLIGPQIEYLTTEQAQERLGQLIHSLLRVYAESHSYQVSLLNDVKFLGDEQRRRIRSQERDVVDQITSLIGRAFPARATNEHRSATTMSLLGMLNFSFAWWDPAGPLDADGLATLMVDLWFRGLATPRELEATS